MNAFISHIIEVLLAVVLDQELYKVLTSLDLKRIYVLLTVEDSASYCSTTTEYLPFHHKGRTGVRLFEGYPEMMVVVGRTQISLQRVDDSKH